MADAAERAQWWHTASLMSSVVNLMRGKHSKFVSPKDLHPLERREEVDLVVDITALKTLMPRGRS